MVEDDHLTVLDDLTARHRQADERQQHGVLSMGQEVVDFARAAGLDLGSDELAGCLVTAVLAGQRAPALEVEEDVLRMEAEERFHITAVQRVG